MRIRNQTFRRWLRRNARRLLLLAGGARCAVCDGPMSAPAAVLVFVGEAHSVGDGEMCGGCAERAVRYLSAMRAA